MEPAEIIEMGNRLRELPHITPWEKIRVGGVYHVPPLLLESSKDIAIVKKDDSWASFIILGEKNSTTLRMPNDCVIARFLCERRPF